MNGNTPYAGRPGTTQAGKRANADLPDLSPEEKRRLRRDVTQIAARTRRYLPDEYVVDSEISHGAGGPTVTVAVKPPVGRPISAGFSPEEEQLDRSGTIVDEEDRLEVARGLAASAALQVKQAVSDSATPTAQ